MNWPGENLLIKLWESLADKGVGSLLKPWQIRREGRANVDVRRYEILALADAEREAMDIRSGKCKLENVRYVLSLPESSSEGKAETPSIGDPFLEIASRAAVADAMRKEVNVAKAILHAEDELKDDNADPPKQKLDDEWLYRWRDYAGSVSSEQLQAIWGRILAGELKSPGQYSYRLLDFVRNLTTDEASLIGRIAPFVLVDFVVRDVDATLKSGGVTFAALLQLQDLGILSGVAAVGVAKTFKSFSKDRFVSALLCHGRGLLIEDNDSSKTLKLNAYLVTNLGKQVLKLGKFVPNEEYLTAVGGKIRESNFKVSLIDYVDLGGGEIRVLSTTEIPPAQSAS
jgi:hypothetical protein